MPMELLVFQPGDSTTLAVTSASARVALPTIDASQNSTHIRIANAGATDCFFAFGNSTVTAAAAGAQVYLKSGAVELFRAPEDATHLAAITASGTTTLYITRGRGA